MDARARKYARTSRTVRLLDTVLQRIAEQLKRTSNGCSRALLGILMSCEGVRLRLRCTV